MQRRAAALYAVLFVVLAAGAYAMIGVAEEPTVSVANPDQTLSQGDSVTVGGQTYTVVSLSDGRATFQWTNQSALYTADWDNGSTITLGETNFTVRTQPQQDAVQLRENQTLGGNVTTTTVEGTTFVVVEEDGQRRLVPVDEYRRQQFGEPETRQFSTGDRIQYQGNRTTLATVTNESATLEWTAPMNNTIDASEGSEITLGNQQYVAHFPGGGQVELTSNVQAYQHQLDVVDNYRERINGLWAMAILSGLAAIIVLGVAYLPSRY